MSPESLREAARRMGPAVGTSALVAIGWLTGLPVNLLWRAYRRHRPPEAGLCRCAACG
jgi:hypothetical protein